MYDSKDSTKHSPIIGWAFDGFPVYGPFGYSDPKNVNSGIRRIQTGYKLRNINDRTTLANGTVLSSTYYGPSISTYPLGAYIQDYEFDSRYDLDVSNGRFGITPEFPNGVYAYFVATDSSFKPVYPFVVGPYYYGVAAQQPRSISETTSTYFSYKC